MAKKKQLETSMLQKKWYEKISPRTLLIIAFIVGLTTIGYCATKVIENQQMCIQKNEIHNYVCQVVDFDNDMQMLGVKCLVK